jgi:ribonuclease D
MTITLHRGDLPAGLDFGSIVAIDTETMGLNPHRDRLCLVQLSAGDGNAHIVQIPKGVHEAPRLEAVLASPVYCTKIAAKLTRTFTDRHGLRDLCKELLGVEISKQMQTSDWGAETLSEAQLAYAASDVLHLHALKAKFDELLAREERTHLAEACFAFLPTRAELDLAGWPETDIFAHS